MQIKFMTVETTDKKTKTNKDYIELEVSYKNLDFDGKLEVKKLNPFGNKDVYNTLKSAKMGDIFAIERVKNEGGFWDWVSIKSASEGASSAPQETSSAKAYTSPKSTYETPEERAKKQVYIVRQSSLSTAVEYLVGTGAIKKSTAADVIFCAKEFEDYVFGNKSITPLAELPVDELGEDDIPY